MKREDHRWPPAPARRAIAPPCSRVAPARTRSSLDGRLAWSTGGSRGLSRLLRRKAGAIKVEHEKRNGRYRLLCCRWEILVTLRRKSLGLRPPCFGFRDFAREK